MSVLYAILLLLTIFLPTYLHSEVVDRVVAIVNDDIITLRETERYVPVEKEGSFPSINEYVRNIKLREKMDILIDDVLIRQQAKKLNIVLTDKEVEGVVANIKKQHLIGDEEFKEQLAKEGIGYKDFLAGVKASLLRSRVLARLISPDVTITENDLKDYYNKHLEEFRDEDYRLKHIFFSPKRPDIENRAMAAYKLLKEGQPFESVAKEFSDDPSAAQGGDIGFMKKEDLIPEFKGAVHFLTPGGYSQILKTNYGLHILKLIEVRAGATLPFDTVKTQIQQKIVQEQSEKRYKDFINNLRKASYIEVKV
jgi:peptidyl-prolyl cis-trans isomerase SurA